MIFQSTTVLYFSIIIVLANCGEFDLHSWTAHPDSQRGDLIQRRHAAYNNLPDKSDRTAVERVCGFVPESGPTCSTGVGPKKGSDHISCDRYCCSLGYVTGHCTFGGFNVGGSGGWRAGGGLQGPLEQLIPGQSKDKPKADKPMFWGQCECSNDVRDTNCGPDSRFLGISCPDLSACRRKCCREGKGYGGRCGGFLGLKCKC